MDQTLHIKQVTRFSADGQTSDAVGLPVVAPLKAPRAQPKGLRPAFTPIGVPSPKAVESKKDADGDVEMATASSPAVQDSHPTGKKRKRKHMAEAETSSSRKDDAKKARVETPIAPPSLHKMKSSSSTLGAASKARVREVKSKAASSPVKPTRQEQTDMVLSSTQPTTPTVTSRRKETPIPIPKPGYMSSTSSHSTERMQAVPAVSAETAATRVDAKPDKKKKKRKSTALTDDTDKATPKTVNNLVADARKVTPIVPPSRGAKRT